MKSMLQSHVAVNLLHSIKLLCLIRLMKAGGQYAVIKIEPLTLFCTTAAPES